MNLVDDRSSYFGETLRRHQMFTVPSGCVSWCQCCSPLIAVLLSDLGPKPNKTGERCAKTFCSLSLNRTLDAGWRGWWWDEWEIMGREITPDLIARACLLVWYDTVNSTQVHNVDSGFNLIERKWPLGVCINGITLITILVINSEEVIQILNIDL